MKVKEDAALAPQLCRFHVAGEAFSQEEARAVHPGLHGGQAQVQRFGNVLAQGSIVEQKELLRGFIGGIAITPSKDRGVITWYDMSASLMFSGGNRQKLYRKMKGYGIPADYGQGV